MPKNKRASDVMFCFTRHNRATFHYAECQPTPDQARVVPSLSARLRRGRAASHGARLISDYANGSLRDPPHCAFRGPRGGEDLVTCCCRNETERNIRQKCESDATNGETPNRTARIYFITR